MGQPQPFGLQNRLKIWSLGALLPQKRVTEFVTPYFWRWPKPVKSISYPIKNTSSRSLEEAFGSPCATFSSPRSIFLLSELAPFLVKAVPFGAAFTERLLRFHRAGPSTSLDKKCLTCLMYSVVGKMVTKEPEVVKKVLSGGCAQRKAGALLQFRSQQMLGNSLHQGI